MSTMMMGATVRRIHLLGVCGTAMASPAALLQASGYTVIGFRRGRLSAHE